MPKKASRKKTKAAGNLWAVVMAGGTGTRFWPESREDLPKQFLPIFGKKTLIEQTLDRLGKIVPRSRVIVVTQQSKVKLVQKLLKLPKNHIIGEPVGRNTAPCAALAAMVAYKKDPNAVIAMLPADHGIGKEALFRNLLSTASKVAYDYELPVTFGIKPDLPHTGYGYLEIAKKVEKRSKFEVYQLKCFREKPSLAKAKQYVKSKKFLWNSGMFVWRADSLLDVTRKHQEKIYQLCDKITSGSLERGMKLYFKNMTNVSIDYGLMEKLTGKILTIPVDLEWNDLGGWQSFDDLWKKDANKNVLLGKGVLVNSSGNLVKSDKRLVALLGVDNFVVVDTKDALLICPKEKAESVRDVVMALKNKNWTEYL